MRPSFAFLLFFLILFLVRDIRVCNGDDHQSNNGGDHQLGNGDGKLRMNYYERSCPFAETIVRTITWKHVEANPSLAAKLLRLHFHDCFVRGCDASILLDTTPTNTAEKDAFPNLSLLGYDIIDEIKKKLEEVCNGTVSCADIVALAARDGVAFQFRTSMWDVYTGRKDGKISLSIDITANLPSPFSNFNTISGQFKSKGLDVTDLVALSGAHTIGVGHCFFILTRLYNFTGKGDTDPSLDPTYAETLRRLCPINSPVNPTSSANTVGMDPGSSTTFDSHYFQILNQNQSLFQSDAALLTDPTASRLSQRLQIPSFFFDQFARSMVKMGAIGVLTDGNGNGEVRRNCRVVNS